ncbi:MAG: hypothetical protein M1158_01800 [Candidatus Marsarchaeota archaeon]|nr:hypothetical protein [Candidatus Marsarchaeota archaeon]
MSEERKERAAKAIREEESIKASAYMKLNNVPYYVAMMDLNSMMAAGIIVRQSGGRGSSYKRL